MFDSKITLTLKPGKKVKKVIDNIHYVFEPKSHPVDGTHYVKVYDETNSTEYMVNGSAVINLKIFEIRTISEFDSSRGSLLRSKNIELTIL